MAALLSAVGDAIMGSAGTAAAAGGGSIMGTIGTMIGSSLMGDANKDTGGAAGNLLSSMTPAPSATGDSSTPQTYSQMGYPTAAPQPSTMSGYGTPGQQSYFSPMISKLLGN